MVGERGQFKVRASQGHAPRGAARPLPVEDRAAAAHREERAVRHPVGPALAHRHDRHRLGSRQGAPRRDRRRHRLPARARQQGARRAAHPRRRRGRLRRPAAAARRRERPDLASSAASTSSRTRVPGLVVVAGGKWTTYRIMAKDAIDEAVAALDGKVRDSRSPRTSRCSAPRATRRPGTSAARSRKAFGVHKVRIEHLLNRYGVMTDELLDLHPRASRARRAAAGRRRLHRRRGRLRGVARGRAAPRRRARPPHPHLDRGVGPRRLAPPRSPRRSWARCSAGTPSASTREIAHYLERVAAERAEPGAARRRSRPTACGSRRPTSDAATEPPVRGIRLATA